MLAAQAEGLKEALTDRRDVDAELAHAVVDDGFADGRMFRRLVLDDLQRPDTGALNAATAQEESAIACWAEQSGAGARKVGRGIEVVGDTDGVLQDCGFDVIASIDVDPAHQLDELARLGQVVAAGLVDRFADEVDAPFQLSRVSDTRKLACTGP